MGEETKGTSRGPVKLVASLLAAGVAAVVLWSVEIGYQASSAGPVSDAADAIVVEGVDVFPPTGELVVLTVIHQDINIFELLIAEFDPAIDTFEKQTRRRAGETDEEYRNRVLQQMDDSNFRSIAAALNFLGIEMEPFEVVINDIVEGVPAAAVLELGDSIVSLNGVSVTRFEDVPDAIEGLAPGDVVPITVERDGSKVELELELADHPDRPGDPMIGIVIGELVKPPFPIEIRAGDVGGPSAGLMHALAIIDTLTEGELTAGRVIAGTGTITVDGVVGNIGSIRQKVVGAEASGAEFILVPETQYETALTAQYDSIEIVPVATLEEAVEFLESLAAA